MDEIFEAIFEIIFDGLTEAAANKRVPFLLRVFAGVLAAAFFVGMIFVLTFAGISCLHDPDLSNKIVPAVLFFAFAAGFTAVFIWQIVKFFRNRA